MKPLEGVRVIELARILAGPWCGQLLADLGAEVIKIERPGKGDDTRQWGPPFVHDANGDNLGAAYYHSANRGKQSLAIDIASEAGQAAVRALVADADVLIENYKVGGLKRYGLDYASLAAINPRLVCCSITGFGQNGPYADRAGYDYLAQGMGGFMSLNGDPSTPPQKAGIAYADIFTGVYSGVAILAALRRRDATGSGAHIDMALLDTQVAVLANQALNWMVSGEVPQQLGNAHPNLAPYQTFAAANGDLIIAVGNDAQFGRLCEVLGLALADDARFATNPARVANRETLAGIVGQAVAGWSKGALSDALEAVGVPAGPINRINEAFADAQIVHRGMAIERDGVPGVASPIVIDGERMVSDRGSPPLP
ncbi:CaiB/BaiF CoA transferase family protein [Sphingomonas turrisvirgatae]|uniref:CoA-transferase n=1 Tax=Sphingomonas turrisvirgatae TaxID=1888892 RepID=A0A1E3LSA1_9SPHN|nr:CaiB/BaiF CoA-transferase family protein [Sphingomonas turrisvirgatae]ODP36594.1 CoA-transferase [Sphingomonas turrisvirgatae]